VAEILQIELGDDLRVERTARTVLEAGVLESDLWLRQLWEHAPDAMALSDASGTVLAANPAYYELYGYGPDEVVGKNFALIFPIEHRAAAQVQYQEIFDSEAAPPMSQSIVTSKAGLERVVESRVVDRARRCSASSVTSPTKSPLGTLLSAPKLTSSRCC
jgi:PAS domain S-box-containing protein